jgi:hypothetical protein
MVNQGTLLWEARAEILSPGTAGEEPAKVTAIPLIQTASRSP